MPFVLNFANLDQFRPRKAQAADLEVLRGTADVTGVVEWSRLSQQRIFARVPVQRARSAVASPNHFGQRIRNRHFRAVLIHAPGLPPFWDVVAHPPPLRMRGPLYWATARRLRRFIRSLPGEKVVWADWNWKVKRDPCRLRKTFGGRWFGTRIDGCWVSPGLVKHVADYREVPQPERTDKHPFCYLTLEAS